MRFFLSSWLLKGNIVRIKVFSCALVNNLHGEGKLQFVILHLEDTEQEELVTTMFINTIHLEAYREGMKLSDIERHLDI